MTTEAARRNSGRLPFTRGRLRFRVTTLLGLVTVCALGLAGYIYHRGSQAPWERAGGMIGWRQSAIEARLGAPQEVVEADAPDAVAHAIRPRLPGTYRTLVYDTWDGRFVIWLRRADDGDYDCFQSSWANRHRYY